MTSSTRPDLVVVAMDTVRAADFYGVPGGVTEMPFCRELYRESIRFPHAISVAPWTVPAHATIFTGLYPWEHGCHNRRSIKLDPTVPRIPQLLRPLGYRSASLSSNFLIGPELGFTDGFDYSAWGGWWEAYFRVAHPDRPTHESAANGHGTVVVQPPRRGPVWSLVKSTAPLFHQYPVLMDSPSRVLRRIRFPTAASGSGPSPWIEPTLERWIRDQPTDSPIFAFINLLEAHEPYFPSEARAGLGEYWRASMVRQDRLGWLSGEFDPRPADLRELVELYRGSIQAIDTRIEGIVRALKATNRWDRTALIVTSDHGQAFGEHGLFFHMLRVDDAEIRIPLWLRLPGGERGGRDAPAWASLADLVPTLLEIAGDPYQKFPSSRSLLDLVEAPREEPVLCAADGILADPMLLGLSSDRRAEYDRPWIGAYEGDRKLVLDVDRQTVQLFDTATDPEEARDLWPVESGRYAALADRAKEVGQKMTGQHREAQSPELEERLRSWGYI